MSDPRKMQLDDLLVATTMLMLGVVLGFAVGKWITLEGFAFWLTVIYIFIPIGFVLILTLSMRDLSDRRFFGRAESGPVKPRAKRKPFALMLSMPVGLMIGVSEARFGLTEILL